MNAARWTARVRVPKREDLVRRLAARNRALRWFWLPWTGIGLAMIATWRPMTWLESPWMLVIAVGLALGPMLMTLVRLAARRQILVADLAPGARIGRYTREDLLAIAARVHERLGTPPQTSILLTRDKSLNASALKLGFGSFFPWMNAITIHRQMLHVLDADELASVIAHELGHLHHHDVDLRTAHWRHLLAHLVLALTTLQWTSGFGESALIAVVAVLWAYDWVVGALVGDPGEDIEFLCDDDGAQVVGVNAAIHTELKLALDTEATLRMTGELVRLGRGVPLASLLPLYEEVVPFGEIDEAELKARLGVAAAEARHARESLSWAGFLEYLSPADEEAEAEARERLVLPELPLIQWDRRPLRERRLTDAELEGLVSALRAHPERLIVANPAELGTRMGVHPTATRRILYLWENRAAIDAESARRHLDAHLTDLPAKRGRPLPADPFAPPSN